MAQVVDKSYSMQRGTVLVAKKFITPLGELNFDGLTAGQSITPLVSAWGTFGNGYGCQGDTTIKMPGATSSCNISIQNNTTGRPTEVDTPPGNGDFGFIRSFNTNFVEGDEFWLFGRIYFPVNFNFNTESIGLKFIRYSYPVAGPELDTYIADGQEFTTGDNTANAGFHLVNESFPQLIPNMHRKTSSLFVRGQWNTFCKYTKCSNSQASSAERLWINDAFVMEHVGGVNDVTTRWFDGTLQTAVWTPSAGSGGKWATLNNEQAISSFYLFTYWNNRAKQDQSCNVQKIVWHNNANDLLLDQYGNIYINSLQVS